MNKFIIRKGNSTELLLKDGTWGNACEWTNTDAPCNVNWDLAYSSPCLDIAKEARDRKDVNACIYVIKEKEVC